MKFHVFVPPAFVASLQADAKSGEQGKCATLFYLSGLTCTDENFIQKAGAQRFAADSGVLLVCPDTSPRGVTIEGQDDSWDFGSGAGFYVNATEEKWKTHYRMFDYVTLELPSVLKAMFPFYSLDRQSITGHSMGGHGALICALKNPGMYKSVSAFAPISNPMNCPWGQKAFTGYLGADTEAWKAWDATELVVKYTGTPLNILIDQGTEDKFYKEKQLLPENFKEAASQAGIDAQIRFQEGYDHSYFFVSTFIADHIEHHCKYLCQ